MKTNWMPPGLAAGLLLTAFESLAVPTGPSTDLAIGLTASTNAANVGDEFTFQISVANLGPAEVSSATIQDTLPAGLQYLSSAGPGTYNPSSGQWTFTGLASGFINILTIQVQATSAGNSLNSATITASTPPDNNSANNTASAGVTVNVPVSPLVLNCPSNIMVMATSSGGATVFFNVTASGGCSPPPYVSANPPSGSTFPIGTTTVTTTASDSCGSTTNCSFTVTVCSPPIVLNCSSNIVTTATSSGGATVFFNVTATGGCSPPPYVSANPPSGSTFPIGTTTVTTTASDSCGSTTNCSFTVTVCRPPIVLNCSSNIVTTATSSGGATVYFNVTASGGCSPPPYVSANPPSGSTFPIGTTTVTTTASDSCGSTTNCSFTVTVCRPPIVLNCSSNIVTTATSSGGATVYFNVTASGGCSPPPYVSANPPSGSTFPIGTTTVTTTASDSCGSTTNCSFTVTVCSPPIVLNCSSNIVTTATSSGGATVFFNVTATGGCSPPPYVSANPPSGSTFPMGTTTVLTSASDSCGSTTNCSFTVTVNPPVYPPIVLTNSTNLTVTATSMSGATVFFTNSASGGCSNQTSIVSFPPSGSTFPIGTTTVTNTASDNCDDTTNGSFTVTVVSLPILLNCSSNIVTTAASSGGTTVYFNVTASGGCTPPTVSANPPSGSTFPMGTTTVMTTASDACGNTTNCSFTVTVNPPVYPPIVLNCSSNLTVTTINSNGATVFFTVTATGGCTLPTVSAYPPSGSTFPMGTTTVTTVASDTCGNSTNCSFTVTVNYTNNLSADLSVVKTGPPDPVLVGANITYSIVVSNAGPNTASNVVSRDAIPTGTTFVSATPPGYTYYPNFLRVDTEQFNLAPGATFTWTVTVQVTNAEQIINAANAFGSTFDPNTTNNVGWATNNAVNPSADLSVVKTGPPDPVLVGANITYSIVVSNAGPNTASNVVSRDAIPDGTTFVSATPPGYTYYPEYLRVDTEQFNLAPGATFTWTVTVQVTNAEQIINAANAFGSTFDPNTTNNVGWATNNAVNPSADLSVVKTGPPDPVLVGANITYSIVVSNAGPNTASNVVSRDAIPDGTTFVSATPPGYTYYPEYLRVDTEQFNLAPGATFTWTVTVQVTNAEQIINAANAFGSTFDPNTTNNVGWATNNAVNPSADLSVVKTGPPDPVLVGANITYSIVVSNAGPNTASNVVSRDAIPNGTTFVSATPPGYTYYPEYLRVDTEQFNLAPGATFTWTVTVQVTNAEQIINAANAFGSTFDPNTTNNVGWATNNAVNPSADLSVVKTGPPDPVLVGANITYSIVVSNAGPNTASNVVSRDAIPDGTTFVSATPPGYTYYPNFLRVDTAPFNLAPGATFTWTVTVQVTNAEQIINAANAYGSTFDPNTTNNVGWATNNAVNPSADLSVVKTGPPDPVLVGANITYSIVVSNAGPNTASNVISRDAIPNGTTFVSATPPGYTYYPEYLRVDTEQFNLAPGATFTWTVTVQVTNAEQIINAANAFGSTFDPNTTNNVGWATNNAVNPSADLSVVKTGPPDPVLVGANITYSIVVSNAGPNTASNVVSRDAIPDGTTFVSATPPGYTYYPNFLRVDTAPFNLAPGATFTWTVTVQVTNAEQIINAANAYGSTFDPNTTNNVGWATNNAVNPSADLSVVKTGPPDPVLVGANITYSIVVSNAGPNTASNVISRDAIPNGTTFVSATPPGYTYYPNFLRVDTAPFNLAPGATFTWTVTVQVTNAEQIINAANAYGSTFDPNTTNNVGWATNNAVNPTSASADLQVTKIATTNSVFVGGLAGFLISVTNVGPTTVSNVVVTDVLPRGLTYSSSGVPGGTTFDETNDFWTINSLAPGSGSTLALTTVASIAGTFTNTASLTSSTPADTNAANNTASAVVTATVQLPSADLQITKTVSPTNAATGTPVVFRLQLQNLGPNNVTNPVVVTDNLPPGFQYVTDSTVGGGGVGTYSPGTGWWTVPFGAYTNVIYNLFITAVSTNAGRYTNTATVAVPAGYADPNTNNNTSSAVVSVYPVYTLSGYVLGCQTNGPAIPYITVNLSGSASATTMTATNGFYIFSNLLAGTYTVTPTQPGNAFTPTAIATLGLSTNTVLQPFLGNIGQIRGSVIYGTNGPALPGAYVQLTGGPKPRIVQTDTNGIYCFTNTPPGNYTVTPVVTNGFVFAPTNAALTISATNCVGVASFTARPRALQLVALEVIQVIQNWSNSIVLIQNKETWVRAHLQLPSATNPPVLVQGARLYGPGGASVTPFNAGGTLLVQTTNAAAGRGQLTNSLNFRLPAAWLSGTINLQFVATNFLTIVPTNTVAANSTVQVTFTPSQPLPLLIIPVNWVRSSDRVLQQNSAGNLADLPRRLLSIYPVPSVDSSVSEPITAPFRAQPVQSDYTALNRQLTQLRAFVQFFINDNRLYHGAVARGGPAIVATGEAYLPGYVSSALMPNNGDFYVDPWLRHLASHEIGHNFGLNHDVSGALFGYTYYVLQAGEWVQRNTAAFTANSQFANGACGESGPTNTVYPLFQPVNGATKPALGPMTNGVNALVYGLDTLTRAEAPQYNPVVDPNANYDVMGYCYNPPLQWWISASTYPAMLNYVNNTFQPAAPAPAPGPARQWRFFRGPVDFSDNTASFLPFYDLTTTSGYVPPTETPGNYSLRIFDASGDLMDEIPFTPVADTEETLGDNDVDSLPSSGSFNIPVPISDYPAPVARVQLWENGDQMLAQEAAPVNQPEFTSGLSVVQSSNLVQLAWGAVNAVSYALQYSPDGGTTWSALAVDMTNAVDDIDTDYLSASSSGLFRVIATDGFDSTNEYSTTPVMIPNHPPTLSLDEPMDGSIYIADQQIVFSATANDMQDGPLSGASIQWTDSLNGVLGTGNVLNYEADALSVGTHVITVTATDNEGLTNSASVTIYVLAGWQPALAIETDGNQVLVSWPSSVTSYVLESTPSLAPATWSTVTNTPVAADITQTVTLDLSNTNQFFRLRLP